MIEKIKEKIYNILNPKEEEPQEEQSQEDWVTCINCGFKGSFEEFLVDGEDTKCPKCGEDIQIFEL